MVVRRYAPHEICPFFEVPAESLQELVPMAAVPPSSSMLMHEMIQFEELAERLKSAMLREFRAYLKQKAAEKPNAVGGASCPRQSETIEVPVEGTGILYRIVKCLDNQNLTFGDARRLIESGKVSICGTQESRVVQNPMVYVRYGIIRLDLGEKVFVCGEVEPYTKDARFGEHGILGSVIVP